MHKALHDCLPQELPLSISWIISTLGLLKTDKFKQGQEGEGRQGKLDEPNYALTPEGCDICRLNANIKDRTPEGWNIRFTSKIILNYDSRDTKWTTKLHDGNMFLGNNLARYSILVIRNESRFYTMAPVCALCLRFAAALWPKRHKSYTAVTRARNVLSIVIVLPIFWCLYCRSCLRLSSFRMTIASIRFTIFVMRNNHTGIPILSPLWGFNIHTHITILQMFHPSGVIISLR